MQNFMAMMVEAAEGMSDEKLAEKIAELESGKKIRVSDPYTPTGSLNVSPIMLQAFKRVQQDRRSKAESERRSKKP